MLKREKDIFFIVDLEMFDIKVPNVLERAD